MKKVKIPADHTFKGIPSKMCLVSMKKEETRLSEIQKQRLVIMDSGVVSLSSFNREGEILDSISFEIRTDIAKEILRRISSFFSSPIDTRRYPTDGTFSLTIRNTEHENFYFEGSLGNRYFMDGEDLTSYIRKSLERKDLLVFSLNGEERTVENILIEELNNKETIEIDGKKKLIVLKKKDWKSIYSNHSRVNRLVKKYQYGLSEIREKSTFLLKKYDFYIEIRFSYGDPIKLSTEKDELPEVLKELLNELSILKESGPSLIPDSSFYDLPAEPYVKVSVDNVEVEIRTKKK